MVFLRGGLMSTSMVLFANLASSTCFGLQFPSVPVIVAMLAGTEASYSPKHLEGSRLTKTGPCSLVSCPTPLCFLALLLSATWESIKFI